jgi:alpha-glucosidase (family GH31 glycosyl hydrolase)
MLGRYFVQPAELQPSIYHAWAHKHWVWNHNGNNYQDKTVELVQGYLDHDIPVGAVDIDSMWETAFNNFEPDTSRFPDFGGLVSWLHDQNIRVCSFSSLPVPSNPFKVITWATSMVNVENPDYDMCVEKNYLVRNGKGVVRPLGNIFASKSKSQNHLSLSRMVAWGRWAA